jgi:hypothetical protein
MNDQQKTELIDCFRKYIAAEKALRANGCGWKSWRVPGPEWDEYVILTEKWKKAYSDLWMITEIEYSEKCELSRLCWNWRYYKVMSRKCTWLQLVFQDSIGAGKFMKDLHEAELQLATACGLADEYKSPCQYLEEAFPGLRNQKQ